jgi:alcohol dehydrogenase
MLAGVIHLEAQATAISPPNLRGGSHRARGWLRHVAGMLAPSAAVAARIALERKAGMRVERLRTALDDRTRQRLRPTRPRMRALAAAPGGRLSWRMVAAPPPPGPLAAVVRPIAVATCDLDRAIALGATQFPLPLHLGHECVAEVLTVGDQVTTVQPGQRVVVPFQISCGSCTPCEAGNTGNCATVPPASMYGFGLAGGHWGGAYSEQLAVPYADGMLVPLPDGVDPVAAASVADNVSDGYRHIAPYLPSLLEKDPGAEILIAGSVTSRSVYSASVALYAGLVAQALGARHVHLADARPWVREHAARLGLNPLQPRELRRRPPVPLVADVSATSAGLWRALSSTAPDGTCSSVGNIHRTARIPVLLMYGRNVTLHVSRTHARAVIPRVLELMRDGRLHPEAVTTNIAALDDAPRVLRAHYRSNETKTILTA